MRVYGHVHTSNVVPQTPSIHPSLSEPGSLTEAWDSQAELIGQLAPGVHPSPRRLGWDHTTVPLYGCPSL